LTHPNYVHHHVGVCLDMKLFFVKMNIDHFFWWSNFFGQTSFGNQKFLVTQFSYHWIGQPFNIFVQFDNWRFSLNFFRCYSNFFGSLPRNVLGVSQKNSIIQMTLAIDPTFQLFFGSTQKNLVVNFLLTRLNDWKF